LDNQVFDIINARCNHEVLFKSLFGSVQCSLVYCILTFRRNIISAILCFSTLKMESVESSEYWNLLTKLLRTSFQKILIFTHLVAATRNPTISS